MRRRIATTVVAGLVALATLMPASPAQAANAIFQAATLNIYEGLNDAQFTADLNLITSRADLVGLNEVGARKDRLQQWANANGWWLYAPGGRPAAGGRGGVGQQEHVRLRQRGFAFPAQPVREHEYRGRRTSG